jgi:amino acid transporter
MIAGDQPGGNTPAALPEVDGAEPKLERVMGPFASFALSLSTICILSGCITSFHVAFCSVGGASIGLGWPLGCLFALMVALTMGQVASAFPREGGPYPWAAILGGRCCGWMTACFELAGLTTAVAAVNLGTCRFVIGAFSRQLEYNPQDVHPFVQAAAVVLMTAAQAFVNHRGIRLTARLLDFAGYLILVVGLLLTGALLLFGARDHGLDPARLVTFSNYSGLPAGSAPVWQPTASLPLLFALGLLLPAYTLTGFDAAAQTAEETVDAERNVPRGIVRAVLVSGVAGWVVLSALVLAAPDMDEAAGTGDQCFHWIVRGVIAPQMLRGALYGGIEVAMVLCGLATLTSTSRLAYAFARDGGTPFSQALSRIGSHHSPSVAIWTTAALATLAALAIPYETLAAACAIYLYLSYVLPTAAGLWAYRRSWTRMGPWRLGGWYRPLAVGSIAGCVTLIVIGVQPPNDIALWVVGGTVVVLGAVWLGYKRRHFPGPPEEVLRQRREEKD